MKELPGGLKLPTETKEFLEWHENFVKDMRRNFYLETTYILSLACLIVIIFIYHIIKKPISNWDIFNLIILLPILPISILNFVRTLRLLRKSEADLKRMKKEYDTQAN